MLTVYGGEIGREHGSNHGTRTSGLGFREHPFRVLTGTYGRLEKKAEAIIASGVLNSTILVDFHICRTVSPGFRSSSEIGYWGLGFEQ